MIGRHQVGPTLYFQTTEPRVGALISTLHGEVRIIEVVESPEDGGWLFFVEEAP